MAKFPTVLILTGGLGTRMNILYPNIPKALIPINGEPFIAHQLRLLARQGVSDIILCVGNQSEPIVEYIGSGKTLGLNINYSYDGAKLRGTGGAVRRAAQSLRDPFAVLYGDSYLDTEFASILNAFYRSNKLALVTVFMNNNERIRSNILYQSGVVLDYNKEKPKTKMKHIDYGLSIFQPQALSVCPNLETFDLAEVFLALIKAKELAAYEVQDRFYEIGSPDGLAELVSHLANTSKKK